ncbi:MAG: hypothetical protein KKC84_05090, partial [Candidatus Omnitrophica bacterium]|nr:hypothetical protein [Candidatus Omnitrophota bacterium]
CKDCLIKSCPAEINKLNPKTATQRIINMICAWRDQLLEILSAMGIRDVRRLRGEVGRAMFYEEIEKEYTGRIEFCRFELGKEYMDFQTPEGQARWETLNKEYGIDTIPCLVMRTQGKELDRMSGRPEKEIVDSYRMLFTQWIDSNLITPEGTPYRFEGTLRLRQNKIEGE